MATSWLPRVRQALAQPDLALAILSLLFLVLQRDIVRGHEAHSGSGN